MSYSFFSQNSDGTIDLQVRDASSNKSCNFNNNGIEVVLDRDTTPITTVYRGLGVYKDVGDLVVSADAGNISLVANGGAGSISTGGANINLATGLLDNTSIVRGSTNANLSITAQGTGDVLLRTNGTTRLTIDDAGISTFSALPVCADVPSANDQLVNKLYVDTLPATIPALYQVLAVGNDASGNNIIMGGQNIVGAGEINSVVNSDLSVVGRGTGDVLIKTATTTRVQVLDSGEIKFFDDLYVNGAVITGSQTLNAGTAGTTSSLDLTSGNTVFVSASGAGQELTIALPSATRVQGQVVRIRNAWNTSNKPVIKINPNPTAGSGLVLLGGVLTTTTYTVSAYDMIELAYNGSYWFVMSAQ